MTQFIREPCRDCFRKDKELEELHDEIERLTEEVNALRLVATAHDAEVDRLRAALADILAWADTPSQEASPSWIIGACERARAALKPKPAGQPKPDLRALLPELAVIRQVMKDPKP
jgi:hypothetical protein